jgi:hypothetical protein
MKIRYFPDTDTLYIELAQSASSSSEAVSDNLIVDFDEEGKLTEAQSGGGHGSVSSKSGISTQSKSSCPQWYQGSLNDNPDNSVVDPVIFMPQLIAKANNTWRLLNSSESIGLNAREIIKSLAYI